MKVEYDNFAETFAQSRKNLKWPELSYLLSFLDTDDAILDIACGSGRLIQAYREHFDILPRYYYGIDASQKLLDEAHSLYPGYPFFPGNMEDSTAYDGITELFQDMKKSIFCIAGFHHILDIYERIQTLKHWYNILDVGEKVYMTNWALESPKNKNSYKNAMLQNSENEFGSHDFSIKIGKYFRWYHSFTLRELEYLAGESNFTLEENRLGESEKNIITILKK